MSVLDRALITSGIKLEIIWLTRMPHRVRSGRVALRIGGSIDDVCAGGGKCVDVWRGRTSDDVGIRMILLDHNHDVVERRLRSQLEGTTNRKKDENRRPK